MKILATLLALLASVPLVLAHQDSAPPEPTVVFLLRHAEALPKSASERDPALAEAGEKRAATLAKLLGSAGATHLFASEYVRTQSTLAPLAEATGLEVTVVPAGKPDRQLQLLRDLPAGSIAVVAGHSNTVPALAGSLGVEMSGLVDQPPYGRILPHEAYDRIAQVVLPAGEDAAVKLIELAYGD